ncbi:hypothetical protein Q4F19_05070 [Sphingomonas sp. BIUV-7]|uniref:Uncharacterized protein n=1 Tax=Sphingomonas natans TaxID=3063330 RepID=A0ABT8Y5Z3_9SPHN|nr:hypothetical protein [Sphingomonas sp. BIUV-7]MDO6413747.1 hypothetical protein [Sphingomonas sp. BIUV-7]
MTGLLWAGLLAGAAAAETDRLLMAQLTIRSRVVVRVQTNAPPPPPVKLVEKKGPRCVPMADVLGAAVVAGNSVDFVLRGGKRMRARFASSCPALDYYSGFYIVPTADGMICSDRDSVRSRAGGECAINRFRLLAPKKDD